ncbi:hypothetical protein RhiirA4_520211 [Rhizophagus irregularis]|uniref:DUF7431 domain-containing protein n=1 Tax=Rhizophagus irregularis TaxID=588596 RepID=A0A2I1HPS6_9GLOM|nr:hypothetical protein RhiirA4_520211 [Rhizophagus irregularis]
MDIKCQSSVDSINMQYGVDATVQINDPPSKFISVNNLNLKDKLSNIRRKLVQNSEVKMNHTFSFANKINNKGESSLAVIAREDEENIILEKIMDKNSMFLYLKSEPKPDWKFLKDKLKLEYGCTETLEKANKRAFTIVSCEMNEIIDGYENNTIQIDLEENKIIKHDFLLIADIDIPNFTKLGVSIKNSNIKNSNIITSLTYNIIEHKKVSLKFKLEPTTEFIEAVKDVIDSKDPRKFKDVINDFGQFIPKEVVLGKLFGSNSFNESDWIETLNDYKYWSCIKLKDPVNIFQLLSKNLRKRILSLVGKKILFTSIEEYSYKLPESGSKLINIPENILKILQNKDADCNIFATVIDKKEKDVFSCQITWPPNEDPRLIIHCIQKKFRKRECKLKIKWMIVGYDTNFDFNHTDFNTKLKVLKNDFNALNCQAISESLDLEYNPSILCFGIPVLSNLDSSNDSLVIGHHFSNDRENRKVGSYIFSYCLEKNHYVNLPNFTFYTLIISNYPNSDNYGISTFQHTSKTKKLVNFIKFNSLESKKKFFSLYSAPNNYGPIFLKQKASEIKGKYINVNCNQDNCICKRLMKLENSLKYAFFDPKNSD